MAMNQKIDPGIGYRLLEKGEALQEGDQYFFSCNPWINTERVGDTLGIETVDVPYRRRVQITIAEKPSEAFKVPIRKQYPLCTGLLDYFPDALMCVAEVSRIGNEQHNPGRPMHWDRDKSSDEEDALLRHLKDRGKRDNDGLLHTAKVAWRALALLQKELEAAQNLPLPRAAKSKKQ